MEFAGNCFKSCSESSW